MKQELRIKIFLFHRISPEYDPLWNPIHPDRFRKIIRFLQHRYEIVPLEQTVSGLHKPKGKKDLCAITFDDGFKDFQQYSFPILKNFEVPVSLFLVSGSIESGLPPWTYLLNYYFIHTKKESILLESSQIEEGLRNIKWNNTSEKLKYASMLATLIKSPDFTDRTMAYEEVAKYCNDVPLPENFMLSWSNVNELIKNGVSIGSHTLSHPLMTCIKNPEELRKEILESGEMIKSRTGTFPLSFSYPFGLWNETCREIVSAAGYQMAFGVQNRRYSSQNDHTFSIPRIELYSESFLKSRLRISGIIDKIKKIVH